MPTQAKLNEKEKAASSYSGQLHQGLFHGFGNLTYGSGEIYEGSWEKGKREGHGVLKKK